MRADKLFPNKEERDQIKEMLDFWRGKITAVYLYETKEFIYTNKEASKKLF